MKRVVVPLLSLLFISFLLFSFKTDQGDLTQDVLTFTNRFRHSKGKPDLVLREDLNQIATRHSAAMANGTTAFGHGGFEKREEQAAKLIPRLSAFAENVAFGVTTGKEVVELWKSSSGHRENMLGDFKYIGIGIARDSTGRTYYTQVFVNEK